MPDRALTLQQVLDRGLTYRRLDHWARQGWLCPAHAGGTGHNRAWPTTELEVADLMRRLIDAGLTAGVAALAAGAHHAGRPIIKLAPGVVLAIDADLLKESV
ncbi:MerR family transcriptional regulator [Nonomuraea sp. SBT364]|uniref:MerR family transcriptional regulator n=1 Tax=Nonomuraea sp. SBT364 TaxID=1580530 RepID=UPI00066C3D27|nr:MerR family transcriptional regulator [Nonomuraea sp. SBT364]